MGHNYRIYYPDNLIFDSEEGTRPPAMDVQIIIQEDQSRGLIMTHGADFYYWEDGRWWNCDLYGLFRFLMDTGLVLFGKTIPHKEFDEIYREAKVYRQELANAKSSL